MARSLFARSSLRASLVLGSVPAIALLVIAGASFAACGGDDTSGGATTTTGPGGTSTTSGSAGGAGGAGGTGATTSSQTTTGSMTTTTTGTSGGGGAATTTGNGGGGGGQGGAGQGGAGQGGAVTVGPSSGAGGDPNLQDSDGDGWAPIDGDCCDTLLDCGTPEVVNPGAIEVPSDGVDNDCDPSTLDNQAFMGCPGNALDTPTSTVELLNAMELCQQTTENPPLGQKKWGVISSQLLSADPNNPQTPVDVQVGVLGSFGANVAPKRFSTMAAISSGTARAEGDPGYVHPQNGGPGNIGNFNANHASSAPPDYLAGNGGVLPSPCGNCMGPNCTQAFDSVNLKARIRVPTNAKSFSYNFKFYTAEFPEFLCQDFNDFFVALLTSTEPSIPLDKNIAFDANNNPVSVNNAFLDVCFPPINSPPGTCPAGTLELVGNGMGGWNNNLKDGGGTVWLTNDAPVIPGETIELEFVIWDAGDHNVDSIVLLDNFRWKATPATVSTHQ